MAVNAMLGTAVSTSSTIMGRTGLSAVLGQTLSGGASYNPQTQGTLVNWYDASTLGLSNGASVTTLTDSKTGAPNSMTVGSGVAGTYATPAQNSLGTISFNGTNQWYSANGSTASTFPYTIGAVIKIPNTSGDYTIIGPSDTGGLQFRTDSSTGTLTLNKSDVANIGTSSGTVGTGAYHVVIVTVSSSAYAFYIDSASSTGSGSHSQVLTAGRTFEVAVQHSSVTAENIFTGNIGEIQIYSSVLSGSDITGLYGYLKAKWATP